LTGSLVSWQIAIIFLISSDAADGIAMIISFTLYFFTARLTSSLVPTIGTPISVLPLLFTLSSTAQTILDVDPVLLISLIKIEAAEPAPIARINLFILFSP